MMLKAEAILAVRDVQKSVQFYRDVLGFESDWTWGDEKDFGGVNWGGVHIMLQRSPDGPFGTSLFCSVRDANALYERHKAAGVVHQPIEDKPWGMREYLVIDPDGHRLRIASPIGSHKTGSTSTPQGVDFEDRPPMREELDRLREAVGWSPVRSTDMVENTWSGVVALVDSEVVAGVRITVDSEGWYGIWDLIVVPEWQGKRIGESIMQRSVALVNQVSPGAFVFLFTFQNGFYEKLGFRAMEAMCRNA